MGIFLRIEIYSAGFKNQNLTEKKRRTKAEKLYFFKKTLQKILKQTKPSYKISTSKNIGRRNKSNKIAKNYWLSRYKRLRSNKINYMFVTPKKLTKNNKENKILVPKKILDKQINQIK